MFQNVNSGTEIKIFSRTKLGFSTQNEPGRDSMRNFLFDFFRGSCNILVQTSTNLTNPMSKETKESIMSALATRFYDDLEFLEAINDFTYARKVQLKAKHKRNQLKNGDLEKDAL